MRTANQNGFEERVAEGKLICPLCLWKGYLEKHPRTGIRYCVDCIQTIFRAERVLMSTEQIRLWRQTGWLQEHVGFHDAIRQGGMIINTEAT